MDFLRPGLKTGMGNGIFRSEIGSGFGDAGGTLPPKLSTSTPPGLSDRAFLKHKTEMTGDCWFHLKYLQRGVEGKHLIRFQREKRFPRSVDQALFVQNRIIRFVFPYRRTSK